MVEMLEEMHFLVLYDNKISHKTQSASEIGLLLELGCVHNISHSLFFTLLGCIQIVLIIIFCERKRMRDPQGIQGHTNHSFKISFYCFNDLFSVLYTEILIFIIIFIPIKHTHTRWDYLRPVGLFFYFVSQCKYESESL